MPIQQIAVVAPNEKNMDNSGKGARNDESENDARTSSTKKQELENSTSYCDKNKALNCDTDTENEVIQNDAAVVEKSTNLNTHVVADTVIIGDLNSDSFSDELGRQSEIGADGHIHVHVVRPGTDMECNRNSEISNSGTVTNSDKRSQNRSTGKSSKKEKPTPVKKKDSGTQETLHPNSPTPLSAERCDSSMSNVDVCRICQCDSCEIQKESPLVAPCLCSGSLKFIHQACLQKWIKSSDKMSCELCQFEYQMTKKTKPFREWERLDMTPAERRKVICSVTFHVIAITCVVWSLYVLIDRTTEEVQAGSLLWPFWTKLIVVAIGFTGGVVFMYVQCKMYLTLCKKWRTYNKVILVSSISEAQREKANHEGIVKMTEKQAQMEEERRTNFDVFTIVQETDTF